MFSSSELFSAAPTQQVATSPDMKRPKEDKSSCLPTTIRAMEAAIRQRGETGEDLKFFGTEPSALVLVAMVDNVVRQATGLEMVLNDSTGRMKARYFVTDPQEGELDRIAPGCYVSIFGGVRTAPAVHFSANGLRVVESADEISYHMIEVAYAMLRLQMPQKDVATPAPQRIAADAAAELASSTPEKPTPNVAAAIAAPVQATKPAGPMQGADLRAALLRLLRDDSADSTEGLAVSAICSKLSSAQESDIRSGIQGLVDDGEVYATIDDEHFAAV